jgi:23S rRNA (adenine2503-C2)-methyltransferase
MAPEALADIAEMELPELEQAVEIRGYPRFHGRQIYRWVHRHGVTNFDEMTDLARRLRADLAGSFTIGTPRIVDELRSTDGTTKFLLALADHRRIESVYIPDDARHTFCLSTQVGCAMGCTFCLTGRMGLVRHLTAGEIAGQARLLATRLDLADARFNIVLMGMGEPLHNYDETMKALRILAAEPGLAVSPRRVTLSTVGIVPALDRLAHEPLMPNLAISLHATTDAVRDRLVPPNRRFALTDIIAAARRFPLKRRSRITFEYVLLKDVNDSTGDARRLAALVGGLRAKVNLIPLNAAPGIPFERPDDERVARFAGILADRRLTVSVRKSRGRDIRAACGQLIIDGQPSPAQRLAGMLS